MITIDWWWLVVGALVAGAAYVWEKGLLGTATEGRLKDIRDKLLDEVAAFDQKIEAKALKRFEKAKAAKEAARVPVVPHATEDPAIHVELVKDKGTRIAENKALLEAKVITQEQFDAAMTKILAE